jgi:hypothetical protein
MPASLRDLGAHACIACSAVTMIPDRWSFERERRRFALAVEPRLIVNTTDAAIDAATACRT